MTHKLKTLGVAFFAVLALSAVSASAASAVNYTASSYPTTGTGTSAVGNDTFTTEGGTVECASHFQATLSGPSTSLTITPTYTNCKAFGFVNATVTMNGCHYEETEPTATTYPNWHMVTHIRCPAGKVIEVTAGTCKIAIGAQTTGGVVQITNNTAAGDVTVKAAVTGVAYNVTQDGFGCPFSGTGAKTGATYTQHSAMTFDSTNGANIHVG